MHDAPLVQALLAHGANVNARDASGSTALMRAEDALCAQTLLEAGADVNAQNENGWTALMYQVGRAPYDDLAVKVVLQYGADVNAKNKDGWSALWIAKQDRNQECIDLLKAAGAKE
jgi:ankyrin repeat protein